jgi:hypothetical protein
MKRKSYLILFISMGVFLMLFSDCEDNTLGTCTITCKCPWGDTETHILPDYTKDECKAVIVSQTACPDYCTRTFVEN